MLFRLQSHPMKRRIPTLVYASAPPQHEKCGIASTLISGFSVAAGVSLMEILTGHVIPLAEGRPFVRAVAVLPLVGLVLALVGYRKTGKRKLFVHLGFGLSLL